ncbi:hypothetical protein [Oceaniradius stylonematis]|uniref:hypothetical protein n=1 Tax=Oceaniradius stylonematis TaxID=2184161 RepID=UPI00273E94D9|nr:hypothetical protein [Oceaniradius stylonematis]
MGESPKSKKPSQGSRPIIGRTIDILNDSEFDVRIFGARFKARGILAILLVSMIAGIFLWLGQ